MRLMDNFHRGRKIMTEKRERGNTGGWSRSDLVNGVLHSEPDSRLAKKKRSAWYEYRLFNAVALMPFIGSWLVSLHEF